MTRNIRIRTIINNKSIQIIIMVLIGVFIGIYYLSNVKNIYTIWGMPDEAGYLFNATLLTKCNWKETFCNTNSYYGFGYSVLLIPIFIFCKTGLNLIRGAIIINIVFVLLLYFIQIYLMSKILPKSRLDILAVISGISCLYPYLTSMSMQVVCEVFLTFWVWTIGVLLYKALETKKYIYFLLVGVATAYISAIHLRSIAVIVALLLTIIIGVYCKNINLKEMLFFLIPFVCCLLILNIFKKEITNYLGTGILINQNETAMNIITGQYLIDRLEWLFTIQNIKLYVLCAIGKLFYLIVTTKGVILFGLLELIYVISDSWKAGLTKIKYEHMVMAFMGSCFVIMFVLSCLNGTGETFATFIYGRYYEYTVSFLVFLGIYSLLYRKYDNKNLLLVAVGSMIVACIATYLKQYTSSDHIEIDTNRCSGLSYTISKNQDITSIILFSLLLVIIFFAIYIEMNNRYIKVWLIPMIVLISFLSVDKVCLKKINDVNINCKADIDMAEYINKNISAEKIYFVYEPYKYEAFFERMQVFIKNYSMYIILPEEVDDVSDNSFIITYSNSDKAGELKRIDDGKYIMSSTHYELFRK